jgi:hypothetical protein
MNNTMTDIENEVQDRNSVAWKNTVGVLIKLPVKTMKSLPH